MDEKKDSLAHSLVSAFNNITALMKAHVGDAGATANAKQAAAGLSGLHPDVVAAYHEALVTAVTVQHVPVIPLVEPLVEYKEYSKEKDEAKEEHLDSPEVELEAPEGGARMA